MMTTKFIIEKTSNYPNETLIHYYAGLADNGVSIFDSRKNKAKRYTAKEEALRDMSIHRAMHCDIYSFKLIPIRCRV